MKKPKQFILKKWIWNNGIKGLIVEYHQTGTDTAETIWELIPKKGKSKKVKAWDVQEFIDAKPSHASALRLTEEARDEMKEYEEFAKKNAEELEEYERLKGKFA